MRDALTVVVTSIAEHGRCARSGEHVRRRGSKVRRRGIAAALIATVLVCAGRASGQCSYEVQSLDYPIDCGIFGVITIPRGLNNHGAVVGYYYCSIWTHVVGFRWTAEEGFVPLPWPAGVDSLSANDINDTGAIAGSYSLTTGGSHGYVFQDGQYTELLPPPGSSFLGVNAIDNQGMVAGAHSLGANPSQPSAYVWTAEQGFTYLGVMNGPYSQASDVAPAGVVGWTGTSATGGEAFLYHDTGLTLLGSIPGGFTSSANGIEANGTIVGSGLVQPPGAQTRAVGFVWSIHGFRLIDPVTGYDSSGAGNINRFRQVTGLSLRLANPDDRRGYLWQHGVTHDLNDLVLAPPGSLLIVSANAINEHGQIIARGFGGRAFLLTPVGRPLGDVDIDCGVGITDFLWVLREWGQPDSPADLNNDGNVDQVDLIVVVENWGA